MGNSAKFMAAARQFRRAICLDERIVYEAFESAFEFRTVGRNPAQYSLIPSVIFFTQR